MITALGIILYFLILCWFTVLTLASTVPTFGETLFTSRSILHKVIGIAMWMILMLGWVHFFSNLSWG